MSPAADAILEAALQAVKVWAATPSGQKVIARLEEEGLHLLPGVGGVAVRALAAAVPHDVESIGFKKDGPG